MAEAGQGPAQGQRGRYLGDVQKPLHSHHADAQRRGGLEKRLQGAPDHHPDLLADARSVDATVEDASKALLAGEVSVVDVALKTRILDRTMASTSRL